MTHDDLNEKCRAEVWTAGEAREPYDFSSLKGRLTQEQIDQLKRRYDLAKRSNPPRVPTEADDRRLFNDKAIYGKPGAQLREKAGGGTYGRVYKALEATLRRSVAIKILKAKSSTDQDIYEARLSTKVDSHHVVKVDRVGYLSDGRLYIVMEWIEGVSMNQHSAPGQLPGEEQVLQWMEQCCDGMKSLAQAGIVHRDLKPANVMITDDGRVKVLDFGLAKALEGPAVPASQDQTVLLGSDFAGVTAEGRVLGTPAYMSPEQASGKPIDKRADIWGFGCCLYESLTGKRPFSGDSATQLAARILETDPAWEALPGATPSRIRMLVWRCLQKDPQRRLRDIGEARFELSETGSDPSFGLVALGPTTKPTRRAGWALGGLAAGIVRIRV